MLNALLSTLTNPDIWAEGGITMIVGMGIVFSFLVILVFAMHIMTKCVQFINKICPEAVEAPKNAKKATSDDSEIAAAIAVAYSKI